MYLAVVTVATALGAAARLAVVAAQASCRETSLYTAPHYSPQSCFQHGEALGGAPMANGQHFQPQTMRPVHMQLCLLE